MTDNAQVCVIIAARNAAGTIGRAVASALAESETAEVVVVDDASGDRTMTAAAAADDGSGRLDIIRFEENRGPSAARNHAIAVSRAPLIAILDADDFFFPGRFRQLLAVPDWDLIADNIAFVEEERAARAEESRQHFEPHPRSLTLEDFVAGNITQRGRERAEIGFLKPVMRRDFLERHGLGYKNGMRLGEDYDLYLRALACGARYTIIDSCGYGAVVRADSLSGRHRTQDLKALADADEAVLAEFDLSGEATRLVRRHQRQIQDRYALRRFLDVKRERGPLAAAGYALGHPGAVPAIVFGIVRDKVEGLRRRDLATAPSEGQDGLRYLLPAPAE